MAHKQQLLVGAHLSIAGGLEQALITGQSIGCTCVQIFTHSNRQWKLKPLTSEEIERFITTQEQTGITYVAVHASYLINIASPTTHTRHQSVQTLIQELERCEQLRIPYLILHPGSALKSPVEEAIGYCIESLDAVLKAVPGKSMILLENMAGQGSILGRQFEQLAMIQSKLHHKYRIGFCLDTCHAFAAGYDFRTKETYHTMWHEFDQTIGKKHLKVIHMNDSQKPCGSRVDRHAHIGEGLIGLEGFRLIMNDPDLFDIPKILETPKGHGVQDDIRNLATLTSLLNQENKKKFGL